MFRTLSRRFKGPEPILVTAAGIIGLIAPVLSDIVRDSPGIV